MEKFPQRNHNTPSIETPLGKFEVEHLSEIKQSDIRIDDRAFIYTASGNRYMIRYSSIRNNEMVIYNEKNGGFSAKSAHPFLTRTNIIARVGSPLEYFEIQNETTRTGNYARSTAVVKIEIRRGLEKVVAQSKDRNATTEFGRIAGMMRDKANGRHWENSGGNG